MPLKGLRVGFRSEMSLLEDDILLLGRQVERMVGQAAAAIGRSTPGIDEILRADDDQVDQRVLVIEARLHEILTLQGPVAEDLRLLLSLQKVLSSIERIGDGALNVARLVGPSDAAMASPDLTAQLQELGIRAERVVRTSLDQFSHRRTTTDASRTVEEQINLLHQGLTSRLIDHATTSRGATEWSIAMVLVSRQLERIGDHAMKIAGEGQFVVTGERPPPRTTH